MYVQVFLFLIGSVWFELVIDSIMIDSWDWNS